MEKISFWWYNIFIKMKDYMKFFLTIVLLAGVMALAGCSPTPTDQYQFLPSGGNNNQTTTPAATTSAGQVVPIDVGEANETKPISETNTPVLPPTKKEMPKFYPDTGSNTNTGGSGSTGGTADSSRSFTVSTDLRVKLYLVDKYKPGVCFGMPGPIPTEAVRGMIDRNKDLAQFLRQQYNLTSDLEVYNKIKQLQNIQLSQLGSGKYSFTFMDGQCCTLTYYEGQVQIVGNNINDTVGTKETKTNPC